MKRKLLLLSVFTMLLFACSDNLFDGFISDKNSDAAKKDKIENALNNKDYGYIISELGSKDLATLSPRERYVLQCAYMGEAGFDMLNNIEKFYEDNATTSNIILQSLNGGDNASVDDIRAKRESYAKAIEISNAFPDDNNVAFAGGLAAASDVMMLMAEIAANENGGVVSFDDNNTDGSYIMDIYTNMDPADLNNALTAADAANVVSERLDPIDRGASAVASDDPAKKNDVQKKIDDYTKELKDPATGKATESTLADFINKNLIR